MRKKRTIPYDFECCRILTSQIPELKSDNKDWPKHRFGTIETWPHKYPDKKLKIHYRFEFTSSASASFDFIFNHPRLKREVKNAAEATLARFRGGWEWRFKCTISKYRWCRGIQSSLWIGLEEKMGCQDCAKIKRYSKIVEDKIRRYRKDPSRVTYILSSLKATEAQKKSALIALEKLSNKFRKMTDSYYVLTFIERQYYKKLRVLLFPSKKIRAIFTPSAKHGIPLPFQRNF